MRRFLVTLLLLLEPLHFALEALRVFSTIAFRGLVAAMELGAHAVITVLCAGAALAFWNGGPDARRLVTIAVIASVARGIQSVYWSSLPDDTRPGEELYVALTAVVFGAVTLAMGWLKPAPARNRT
jgi:hypothetical protein